MWKEIYWIYLIFGHVPERQGSVGTFSRNRSFIRHHLSCLQSNWSNDEKHQLTLSEAGRLSQHQGPSQVTCSPTHQHAWKSHNQASRSATLGTNPTHQCTHNSHSQVTIGGCMLPIQGTPWSTWFRWGERILPVGPTGCLLHKAPTF